MYGVKWSMGEFIHYAEHNSEDKELCRGCRLICYFKFFVCEILLEGFWSPKTWHFYPEGSAPLGKCGTVQVARLAYGSLRRSAKGSQIVLERVSESVIFMKHCTGIRYSETRTNRMLR